MRRVNTYRHNEIRKKGVLLKSENYAGQKNSSKKTFGKHMNAVKKSSCRSCIYTRKPYKLHQDFSWKSNIFTVQLSTIIDQSNFFVFLVHICTSLRSRTISIFFVLSCPLFFPWYVPYSPVVFQSPKNHSSTFPVLHSNKAASGMPFIPIFILRLPSFLFIFLRKTVSLVFLFRCTILLTLSVSRRRICFFLALSQKLSMLAPSYRWDSAPLGWLSAFAFLALPVCRQIPPLATSLTFNLAS